MQVWKGPLSVQDGYRDEMQVWKGPVPVQDG